MKVRRVVNLLVLATALNAGSLAYADVAADWNTAALNAIRVNKTPPPRASRALAILHAPLSGGRSPQ